MAALGRWRDAMPLENVSDRLIGDMVTEVGQCAGYPMVALVWSSPWSYARRGPRSQDRWRPSGMVTTFHGVANERVRVQQKLACSVGDRPTGAKVRSSVAGIAGGRETELLKPIDKAILGMVSESPGCNANEPKGGLENSSSEGRARALWGKAARIVATDRRGEKLRRGGRDGTVTRAC